jgi:type II secretory pathway pseudopilin PulG
MRNINRSGNQSAFTLIEVIMALLILIIGLLGVVQIFVAATYSNTYAQNTTIAIKAAEDMMELLHSIKEWNNLDAGKSIYPGGTVQMASDGGAVVNAATDPGADYVAGVHLEPVMVGGRQRNLEMKIIRPGNANWNKRRFEIRWQVIGFNAAKSVHPASTLNLTDAYAASPNFGDLSSPTPLNAKGQQSSVYVIMRVVPMVDRTKTSKRVQIASILVNPANNN